MPDPGAEEEDIVARLRLRAQISAARAVPPVAMSRRERRSRGAEHGVVAGRVRLLLSPRLVLAALGILALVVLGAWWWRSPGPVVSEVPLTAATEPAPLTQSTARPTEVAADVWVHVSGKVKRPGLIHLRTGDRVAQAIEAAGGPAREADLARVNLARKVADGEQIHVPAVGEAGGGATGAADGGAVTGGAGAGGAGAGAGGAGTGGQVDINTGDAAALDALPGVGPVLAQRIVDHRTEHGAFGSVEDLLDVSGIGPAVLEKLRDKARV